MSSNPRPLLNSAQVAELLGVHPRTVSRLVKRGELVPAVEFSGGRRGRVLAFLFDRSDVEIAKLRRAADTERTSE